MSQRQALATVLLATLALGAGAAALPEASLAGALAILVQALATMGIIAALLFFGERRGGPEGDPPNPA